MGGVLVHEWLSPLGGSEKVFDVMADTFPDADLLTLWSDDPQRYGGRPVRQTWLASTPLRRSKAAALPFMAVAWRGLPGAYDWALVSSHAFAHHVTFREAPRDFRKLVYVHTPARYLWAPELDPRGHGFLPRLIAPPLRSLDRRRAQEATSIAANSRFVADRVAAAWGRTAEVIHPPVDVAAIQSVPDWAHLLPPDEQELLGATRSPFVLGASRFVSYKQLDLVIAAAERLDLPAVIAGSGPEEARLRARAAAASIPVRLVLRPSDALLYALYQAAAAFVFPGIEDFGIMPVEAMAAGTPVVVGPLGGAQETIIPGVTGVVASDLSPDGLAAAVTKCASLSSEECRTHAQKFSVDRFKREMTDWAAQHVTGELR